MTARPGLRAADPNDVRAAGHAPPPAYPPAIPALKALARALAAMAVEEALAEADHNHGGQS